MIKIYLTLFILFLVFFSFSRVFAACPLANQERARIQLEGSNSFLSLTDTIDAFSSNRFSVSSKCLIGTRAFIPQSFLPNYQEMKSLYYTQNKAVSIEKPTVTAGNITQSSSASPIDLSSSSNPVVKGRLYNVSGNLTVENNITVEETGIIFIDGDLFINTNLTHTNQDAGLVFVVGGSVYITPNVDRVDAFIITHNEFCSAYNSVASQCYPSFYQASKLTINGSLIFLNNPPPPIPTPYKPQFVRANANNRDPSEEINYQPKYLIILKEIFSKDRTTWSEVP